MIEDGKYADLRDFDEGMISLRMDEPEAGTVDIYLSRTHIVGHQCQSCEFRVVTSAIAFAVVGVTPDGLRELADFLDEYAQRLEES